MISRLSCFSCCDYLLGLVAMFELCAFMNHALKWPLKHFGSTMALEWIKCQPKIKTNVRNHSLK